MRQLFPKSWFSMNDGAERRRAAAVDALLKHWESNLANALRAVGHGPQEATGESAIQALASLDGAELIAVERQLRTVWPMDEGWPRRGTSALTPVSENTAEMQAFLFCAACNGNGFVRQQALTALRHYPGRLATAAALIRAEDWVAQVQEIALSVLPDVLGERGRMLFDFLGLLLQLRGKQRVTEKIWQAHIEPFLISPENVEARWLASMRGPASARKFAYELIVRVDEGRREAALLQALSDPHPAIANWVFTELAALSGEARTQLLQQALGNKYSSVRANALRQYVEPGEPNARDILLRSLLDRAAAPRLAAAYQLRARYDESPLTHWRAVLDQGAPGAPIALLALTDVAQDEDVTRLRKFLTHRNGRLRAAVLRGLYRAKDPDLSTSLNAALKDSSTLVVRQSLVIRKWAKEPPDAQALDEAFESATSAPVRAVLAHAAHSIGKWEALEFLLRHAVDADDARFASIECELRVWRALENRRFTAPRPGVASRIRELVETLRCSRPSNRWSTWEIFLP